MHETLGMMEGERFLPKAAGMTKKRRKGRAWTSCGNREETMEAI
jgi:hypothetical protein